MPKIRFEYDDMIRTEVYEVQNFALHPLGDCPFQSHLFISRAGVAELVLMAKREEKYKQVWWELAPEFAAQQQANHALYKRLVIEW